MDKISVDASNAETFNQSPVSMVEADPWLFARAQDRLCIASSSDIATQLKELGFKHIKIVFPEVKILNTPTSREKNSIYQIGFFPETDSHIQTGSDCFFGICLELKRRQIPFEVVLGGVEIRWLEERFSEADISFQKTLDKKEFFERIDLLLVTKRWECGGQALLQALTLGKNVLSTKVGYASDVLESACLFSNVSHAVDLVAKDIKEDFLMEFVVLSQNKLKAGFKDPFRFQFVAKEDSVVQNSLEKVNLKSDHLVYRTFFELNRFRKPRSKQKSVTVWGEVVDGPYGGGNQVLKAIITELRRRGIRVQINSYAEADAHIMNSAFFDIKKAETVILSSRNKPKVVHRIDGPISLYRGSDRSADDKIFEINSKLATSTAFQCVYSWRESAKLGYKFVNPMIIRNATDPELFYPKKNTKLSSGQKVKILSTSWSSNMKKGFSTYEYLDEHLDFSKYDYEFIGRSPIPFKNIRVTEALESRALGEKLREADIYIAASLYDPASNALLEAITSGLPNIYANSGGHSEFTWFSGLPFNEPSEIPQLLDKIVASYQSYAVCTYARNIKETVDGYCRAFGWSKELTTGSVL